MTEGESAVPGWLLFAAFPILWIVVCQLLAMLGGWRSLAEVYPCDGPFAGPKRHMCSASFRGALALPTSYSNVLTLGAGERGVYFSVLILFRAGHAPLLIPYEELRGEERRFLFFPYVRLRTEKAPEIVIDIRKGLALWLERNSNGA